MGGTASIIQCENVLQQITWMSTTATLIIALITAAGFHGWSLTMHTR